MIMLGAVTFLHVLYLGWGGVIILLTLYPTVQQSYIRKT